MKESEFLSEEEVEARRALYEAVGRFAVAFELVVNALRTACRIMLERNGLEIKNQALANIVLARVRAAELGGMVDAMYREHRPDDSEGAKELTRFLGRVDELRARRNAIIHAAWCFECPDERGNIEAVAHSITLKLKRGDPVCTEVSTWRPDIFDNLTKTATELQVYAERLCRSVNQSTPNLANELRRQP